MRARPGDGSSPLPGPATRPTWWPNWLQGKPRTWSPRGPKRCCSSLSCRKSRLVVPQSDATLTTSSTLPCSEPSDSGFAAPRGFASSPCSPAARPPAPVAAMVRNDEGATPLPPLPRSARPVPPGAASGPAPSRSRALPRPASPPAGLPAPPGPGGTRRGGRACPGGLGGFDQ